MRVASVDTGFVPAPPERIFDVLAEPAGYPSWWPGVRPGQGEAWKLPGLGDVAWDRGEVRDGVELTLRLTARRFAGRLQWYLEPHADGTKVYGIVDVETRRNWRRRRQLAVRAGMRGALVALRETAW